MNSHSRFKWLGAALGFLVTSGILVTILAGIYQYWANNISLKFIRPLGNAYEFQLQNQTPVDQVVEQFRIVPPDHQKVIYTTTRDVVGYSDQAGAHLPGGNTSYVPAAEFHELDGITLPANSSQKFRVPPLSSRSWMEPAASIIDIKFQLKSANPILSAVESFLNIIGFRSPVRTTRYLVINNYWTVSNTQSLDEALRIYCRDDDSNGSSDICSGVH